MAYFASGKNPSYFAISVGILWHIGRTHKLIKYYLEDRLERVDVTDILHNTASSDWDKIYPGIPQGSFLGPLLHLIYINDFSKILSNISIPFLFTDDMRVNITDPDSIEFQTNIKEVFGHLNTWFSLNLLSLNSDKILFISKQGIPTV